MLISPCKTKIRHIQNVILTRTSNAIVFITVKRTISFNKTIWKNVRKVEKDLAKYIMLMCKFSQCTNWFVCFYFIPVWDRLNVCSVTNTQRLESLFELLSIKERIHSQHRNMEAKCAVPSCKECPTSAVSGRPLLWVTRWHPGVPHFAQCLSEDATVLSVPRHGTVTPSR